MISDTQDGSNTPTYDNQDQTPTKPRLTGTITDPNDPRLTDGSYASDPNVLDYVNNVQGYGAGGNYLGQGPTKPKAVDAPTGFPDDASVLSQIGQWAAMPGADPSLKNDPNYWLNAIKGRGGLNAGNLQYWQNASVGPTAFFNNPNREGSSTATSTTTIAPPTIGPTNTGVTDQQQKSDELYNFLMGKAHQAQTVDPNDPMIRQQADTYSANMTRTGRQYLSELAERKGSGGNIGAESRMVAEKNAQAGASHEGDLVQHESDQRRQEIEQALATGAQFMTAQQQMSLQKELASIDNATKIYQTQVQDQQAGRSLAQNQGQFATTESEREKEFNDNLRQRAYEYDTEDEFRRSPYAAK